MNSAIELPTKPGALAVNIEAIPAALKDRPQWVVWKHDWNAKNKDWEKVPYRADGRGKASSTDPATWAPFAQAEARYKKGGSEGIAFVLSSDDPFTCIDLDKCPGEEWAVEIMDTLDSYTEESPSGNGYHVWIEAAKPEGMGCKSKHFHNSKVEAYDHGRYMTVTGQRLDQYPGQIMPRQSELEATCAPLLKKSAPKPQASTQRPPVVMDDHELIETMFLICKGSRELFNGNGGDDASGNDQGLCNHLAFMTGSDPRRMDRLFRQSRLMRDKWDKRHRADGATYGQMTIEKAVEGTPNAYDPTRPPNGHTPDDAGQVVWPDPVDLFGNMEPPAFPTHLLPRSIAEYAQDQGELMGVDPAIIGMAALAITAACLDDRIKIQPKRYDPTWTESARLWITPVGDPSTKKSPGLSKALGPAFKVNGEWRKDADKKLSTYEQARKRWEKKAAKEDDPGPPPEAPQVQRLIYEDATVEKLGDLMAKHEPRGALVFRDELTGWLSSMDAYKNGGGADRAAWLEIYNGGPKAVDRVQRGSTFVENWSACILGGIQPSVIQQYAKVTNHDGMLQRFIIVFAKPSGVGMDRRPDMDAKRAYESMVEQVAATTPAGKPVQLSEAAHTAKEALWLKLHDVVRLHPNPFLVAALGKWEGTYARLLLTFHAAECAERGVYPTSEEVEGSTAEKVAALMWDCLLPHAVKFYQQLDDVEDKARMVAGLLLARSWDRFTVKRDLDRYLRASRSWKPWELDETMQRLESFGWLLPEPGKINERGKPSAYSVNPLAHERFKEVAEREKERREAITKLMGELGG